MTPATPPDRLPRLIASLTFFRLAIALGCAICVAMLFFQQADSAVVAHVTFLLLLIVIVFSSAGYIVSFRTGHVVRSLLWVDLLLQFALLWYSGGIQNPLVLFLIVQFTAAWLLGTRAQAMALTALGAGGLVALFLAPHIDPEFMGDPAHQRLWTIHYYQALALTLFVTTAVVVYFVSGIFRRMKAKERSLIETGEQLHQQLGTIENVLIRTQSGLAVFDRELHLLAGFGLFTTWFPHGLPAAFRQAVADLQTRLGAEPQVGSELTLPVAAPPSGSAAALTAAATGLEERRFEIWLSTRGGAPRQGIAAGAEACRVLLVDITASARLRTQIERLDRLKEVGELAASLAHELNTPLGTMHMLARELEQTPGRSAQDLEDLRMILHEANRCKTLTQQLLDFSRLQTVDRQDVHLRDFVHSMMHLAAQRFPAIPIRLQESPPPGPPEHWPLAFQPVQQALLNVLHNACEAVQKRPDPQVDVRLLKNGAGVKIEVQDNGPGLSPTVRDKLFKPFATTKDGGTGLGLYISRKLLSLNDADLTLETAPTGQGALATIQLLPPAEQGPAPHLPEKD